MAVRRKSNWYIYLLAFVITLAFVIMVIFTFQWFLFPEKSEEAGLTSNGELSADFSPTSDYNFNLMMMLSETSDETPGLFMISAYNAVDSTLTFIPISAGISVGLEGRTLPNVYAAQGGEGVISAVADAVGVTCDAFVKFDRNSFVELVSSVGNIDYSVPKTVIIHDGTIVDTINAGKQLFTAEKAFRYIMLAESDESESYHFSLIADLLSELINQNYLYIDSSLLDTYAMIVLNSPETNLTAEDYQNRKAALLNTIMYANSPAEYYVPYGEYADGGFYIAENSITTIRQKAGLE